MKQKPLTISGADVQPGERVTLAMPTPEIYTCAPLYMPMHIIHGKKEGPTLLICGTFYGDEVNGIAIVQRLLQMSSLKNLHGTLIAIPVMNVYGLINRTRLLPDGHDLTTSFPGSEMGSFSSRLAHVFSEQVLSHCTHCVNIRTGSPHTYKIPQIYYDKRDSASQSLASVFEAPVQHPWSEQDEFFFYAATERRIPFLIYEGGEAHRTDEWTIRTGVRGLMKLMRHLKMIPTKSPSKSPSYSGVTIQRSEWIRASGSGLYHLQGKIGSRVKSDQSLALITDPFGTEKTYHITASEMGIITAVNTHPLVYEGQGVIQIGISDEDAEQTLPQEVIDMQPDLVT